MPSRSAVSGFRNTTATKDPQINALSGLGLGTAFKRFVLEDARVRELGEQVVAPDGRHREVFEQGQSPGPVIEFTWALDVDPAELAYAFVRPIVFFVPGPPLPEATPAMHAVADLIVCRMRAFQAALREGALVASGTFERTGQFGPIHAQQWLRRGLLVDVSSDDLLREEAGSKLVIQWSGVVVEVATSHANIRNNNRVRSSAKTPVAAMTRHSTRGDRAPTAHDESIRAAVDALWDGKRPPGMQNKQVYTQIVEWQRKNQRAVASDRTLQRYFSKKR